MENMIESALAAFRVNYAAIMVGDYRGELLADGDVNVREGLARAKQLAKSRVFPDTRKTELEVGAYSSLGILLEAFCRAVHDQHIKGPGGLGYRSEKIISLMGIHAPSPQLPLYAAYRRALDFIGGMTDNYATYLARQVGGLNP